MRRYGHTRGASTFIMEENTYASVATQPLKIDSEMMIFWKFLVQETFFLSEVISTLLIYIRLTNDYLNQFLLYKISHQHLIR
jgi:hypothetical protein